MKSPRFYPRRRHHIRQIIRRFIRHDVTSRKVLLLALLTGILTGSICSLFEYAVDRITEMRMDYFATLNGPACWIMAFLISAVLGGIAFYLMHRFAPEAGGSGIPEIEGAMDEIRPVRWKRVLPVKFFGGTCSLSSDMILGREGPSVQIGGNVGKMVADLFHLAKDESHALLAAGSAAGLAAAFNAPLAGVLFVLEELRPQFRYSFLSIKAVTTTVLASTIIRQICGGTGPVFHVPMLQTPPLASLLLFLIFGCVMGIVGFIFNRLVNAFQNGYLALHKNRRWYLVGIGSCVAGCFGVLSLFHMGLSTGGMHIIPEWITQPQPLTFVVILLAWRMLGTLLCFCSGVPGGIFAPSLALGTLCGAVLAAGIQHLWPGLNIAYGVYPIVGMGALFAASVRAPITGIILVTEMTNDYSLILPLMVTTLSATLVAQKLGGKPIYTQILERTLKLAGQKHPHHPAGNTPQPPMAANE